MPFLLGENVGPYRILEQPGQGGMATVYKAYHPGLDRDVALIALHPAFSEDPTFLDRFQREARVVAGLNHPCIVPIYDITEDEGRRYLVMKFIQGEASKPRLKAPRLPISMAVEIAEAVGEILSYGHEAGDSHRDIKPSTVLHADNGERALAQEQLDRSLELGGEHLEVLKTAGSRLVGSARWLQAAQILHADDPAVRRRHTCRPARPAAPVGVQRLRRGGGATRLPLTDLLRLDPTLAGVTQARYALHHDSRQRA